MTTEKPGPNRDPITEQMAKMLGISYEDFQRIQEETMRLGTGIGINYGADGTISSEKHGSPLPDDESIG